MTPRSFTAGAAAETCGNEKDGKVRRVDPNLFFRSTRLRGHWSLERRGRRVFQLLR